MFLFVPEAGTPAADELEKLAETLLFEDFPDEQQRQAMRDRQRKLRGSLTGKFAGSFTDSANLTFRVVTTISNCNLAIYKNASQNLRSALSDIPLASLGANGREPQLEILEEEILALKEKSLWRPACGDGADSSAWREASRPSIASFGCRCSKRWVPPIGRSRVINSFWLLRWPSRCAVRCRRKTPDKAMPKPRRPLGTCKLNHEV